MTQLMEPNDLTHPRSEDDFEFVDSHAHDNDDLSSLTSTLPDLDRDDESECDEDDPQSHSDITLQMPSIVCLQEFQEQHSAEQTKTVDGAVASGTIQEVPVVMPVCDRQCTASPFDLKSGHFINLPILYLGALEHIEVIVDKIASALHDNFTEDTWTSERYSITTADGKGHKIYPQSKISLQIVSTFEEMKTIGRPFMIVVVLESFAKVKEPNDSKVAEWNQIMAYGYEGVPLLHLVEKSTIDSSVTNTMSQSSIFTHDLKSILYQCPLNIADFEALSAEKLSVAVMQCLDDWAESTVFQETSSRLESTETRPEFRYPSISQIGSWLLVIMAMAYCAFRTGMSGTPGITPSNVSPDSFTFHQITETTALIEIPFRYRTQPRSTMPKIIATVSRDGKLISSQLQLVVDNLYALDWPHSEAHGELVVAAELKVHRESIADAYTVQYSTKTPLLTGLTDKLRHLQGLGHIASDVDFGRKAQELLQQIEESSTYVVKASSERFNALKKSDSFKKMQQDYSTLAHAGTETLRKVYNQGTRIRNAYHQGAKWTQKLNKDAMKTGSKKMHSVKRGLEKLSSSLQSLKLKGLSTKRSPRKKNKKQR